ncbi:MAG: hypothetical protein ACQER7_14700 [Bacteroidota bacterium]
MDIKEELEGRVKRLEGFIEDRGLFSDKLKKAKKAQRNLNATIFLGSLITIAGIAIWAMNRD